MAAGSVALELVLQSAPVHYCLYNDVSMTMNSSGPSALLERYCSTKSLQCKDCIVELRTIASDWVLRVVCETALDAYEL